LFGRGHASSNAPAITLGAARKQHGHRHTWVELRDDFGDRDVLATGAAERVVEVPPSMRVCYVRADVHKRHA